MVTINKTKTDEEYTVSFTVIREEYNVLILSLIKLISRMNESMYDHAAVSYVCDLLEYMIEED